MCELFHPAVCEREPVRTYCLLVVALLGLTFCSAAHAECNYSNYWRSVNQPGFWTAGYRTDAYGYTGTAYYPAGYVRPGCAIPYGYVYAAYPITVGYTPTYRVGYYGPVMSGYEGYSWSRW